MYVLAQAKLLLVLMEMHLPYIQYMLCIMCSALPTQKQIMCLYIFSIITPDLFPTSFHPSSFLFLRGLAMDVAPAVARLTELVAMEMAACWE